MAIFRPMTFGHLGRDLRPLRVVQLHNHVGDVRVHSTLAHYVIDRSIARYDKDGKNEIEFRDGRRSHRSTNENSRSFSLFFFIIIFIIISKFSIQNFFQICSNVLEFSRIVASIFFVDFSLSFIKHREKC